MRNVCWKISVGSFIEKLFEMSFAVWNVSVRWDSVDGDVYYWDLVIISCLKPKTPKVSRLKMGLKNEMLRIYRLLWEVSRKLKTLDGYFYFDNFFIGGYLIKFFGALNSKFWLKIYKICVTNPWVRKFNLKIGVSSILFFVFNFSCWSCFYSFIQWGHFKKNVFIAHCPFRKSYQPAVVNFAEECTLHKRC